MVDILVCKRITGQVFMGIRDERHMVEVLGIQALGTRKILMRHIKKVRCVSESIK